jgi:hypothetical protein
LRRIASGPVIVTLIHEYKQKLHERSARNAKGVSASAQIVHESADHIPNDDLPSGLQLAV